MQKILNKLEKDGVYLKKMPIEFHEKDRVYFIDRTNYLHNYVHGILKTWSYED